MYFERYCAHNVPGIVCRMTGLFDIYTQLSKVSHNSQKSKMFFWRVLENNDKLLVDLEAFKNTLANPPPDVPLLHFHKAIKEIQSTQRFKTQKIDRLSHPLDTESDKKCDKDE